jgi:hypothetical protein
MEATKRVHLLELAKYLDARVGTKSAHPFKTL